MTTATSKLKTISLVITDKFYISSSSIHSSLDNCLICVKKAYLNIVPWRNLLQPSCRPGTWEHPSCSWRRRGRPRHNRCRGGPGGTPPRLRISESTSQTGHCRAGRAQGQGSSRYLDTNIVLRRKLKYPTANLLPSCGLKKLMESAS